MRRHLAWEVLGLIWTDATGYVRVRLVVALGLIIAASAMTALGLRDRGSLGHFRRLVDRPLRTVAVAGQNRGRDPGTRVCPR
jgi:hypothetical protein